jgi:uncharacterized protein (TIGR00304 family)
MILTAIGLISIALGLILLLCPEDKDRDKKSYQEGEEKWAKSERMEAKGGAIILIGPIPIAVGSDSRTVFIMMLIMLAIMLIRVTWLKGW